MLCDPDTDTIETATSKTTNNKLRYLKRYHLENYFLDARTLSKVFEDLVSEEDWLRDEIKIQEKLTELAKETIPYATALIVAIKIRRNIGNISVMPKELQQQDVNSLVTLFQKKAAEEHDRTATTLEAQHVENLVRSTYENLEKTLAEGYNHWVKIIPGKQILARFASLAKLDVGRLKFAYIKATQKYSLPIFDEIIEIFSEFSNY